MYLLESKRFHIWKIHWLILLNCIFCSVSFAEYKELEDIKQSSRQVLNDYAQRLATDDAKYEGIVKFGQTIQAIEDEAKVDVAKLTYQSKYYWRAVMEMTPRDSSIIFAHAHLHASLGETVWANVYFLLGSLTSGKSHREELNKYKQLCSGLNKRAGEGINEGIKYHDQREYAKALEVYDRVIAEHPNSDLAYYEKGLSYILTDCITEKYFMA